jgi:type I restriction enzyme S subunit
LIKLRKAQLAELDLLVKSQFIEMFGDPVRNPKGWEVRLLGELGNLKNGINYSQSDNGYSVRCLGVGDFGTLYEIRSTKSCTEISLSAKPAPDYLLKDNDIVFVRSNGNRALVGRSVEVFPGGDELTFSGFCIRFRKESPSFVTKYLNHALHLPGMRNSLLKDGRGANIQNVNQQMLSALMIPLPPLDLQNRFAGFVAQADKSKFAIQRAIDETQNLFDSLMSGYFE